MQTEVITDNALVLREPQRQAVSAADFMPLMSVDQAVQRKGMIDQFVGSVLREGEDYGTIPGAGDKKVLLKPGAEKLCSIFGMAVTYAEDKIVEDWTGDGHGGEPLFYYSYRAQLSRGGMFMGEAIGSCNSWESKYRYRWVSEEAAQAYLYVAAGKAAKPGDSIEQGLSRLVSRGGRTTKFEPDFALQKRETTGQYGKPAEYWQLFEDGLANKTAKRCTKKLGKKEFEGVEITMDQTQYRIPNPELPDVINTCQKMAQKRALVSAVLVTTNCSNAFTPDLEDFMDMNAEPSTPFDTPEQAKRAAAGEAKRKEEPASAAQQKIPPTMLAYYERIQKKGPEVFLKIATEIQDKMITQFGLAGDEGYMKVCEAFTKKYPNGTVDMRAFRDCLIDLHNEIERLDIEKENR